MNQLDPRVWQECRRGLVIAGLLAAALFATQVGAANIIKVGLLHSLSGTMAISETTLKDMVVDPASNWPLFPESGPREDETIAKSAGFSADSPIFTKLQGRLPLSRGARRSRLAPSQTGTGQ